MVKVIPHHLMAGCNIPAGHRKEKDFEAYVSNTLFPSKKFRLVSRTEDHHPTIFTFQEIVTHSEFSVECIFNQGIIANSLLTLPSIAKKKPAHFLIVGLGGTASVPNQVFLIDTRQCQYKILSKRHLHHKNIHPAKPVSKELLRCKKIVPHYQVKKVA